MRVVLSGGGTGGHIYPALAVARQCEEIDPDAEFLYIGGQRGLESKLVPQEKIPFEAIDITGFRRSLSVENIKTIMRFFKGVRRSKALLKKFKPDVVIGTGGYVCGPVVYAASKLGIPSIIHEQNAIPGLTNTFLSRYVDTVAVSFEGSEGAFPKAKNVLYTGNPRATTVRLANRDRGFATIGVPMNSSVVLVVGGSRGAKAINDAMIAMAPQLSQLKDVHFVYVTGESYYEQTLDSIRNQIGSLPNHLHVLPYIHNMPEVLACTSLIVNRAGASFLAEITSLGIPSILIPSPNVTNNHQEANARTLEKAGASVMIVEKELSGPALFQSIAGIMKDEAWRSRMAESASALGKPDSADILVKEMERLAHKR
ncbi:MULTISPECIES: undecaprenyldiphospho-muramoylpentapeptide beta-N-acetylglucosaminyltransferase [Paenibacillus]|jgi:UDP-N-acetylglucosamine--N-acetylmuramyl-(pentapeptide) pyrophosphoryl-undecaprenol N-acetylglucosamine transferase|uniref:undecaprenyldiphospho-muramoylpentapeptide beta-N-acetylglucosaminyltransferase n=1 Tax=Paenibacillus TaxID=44249 RepID=UPI00083D5B8E|nr:MULTISPECIES: undecaprenyldiphospho-muramoylpentapeptide beta-N-acetylglucosaminyltransferase [Paenibacillus]MCP3743578.1 undecaprenyldiphospho-muramoylpentapeptide beta-N-acetylglucosaminyltransferase [Paenibacillus sp. A3M_27_13]ODB61133.1 undecaprenyldiphospho-muramoylpentapeptide beta-N-acetylglucosaminyltransferase [Paenibacillus polymyxa]OMF32430.1 undecaprenyldiphospho-muramoylpentapeptide beta-N-acetylglucosaminyltransferase [Paenibacillus peoriae]QYK68384.1 UDP-N-acetylglucosamine--